MTEREGAVPAHSRLVATLLFGALATSGSFFIVVAVAPLFDEPALVACASVLVLLAASACGLLRAFGFFDEAPDQLYVPLDVEEDADGRGPLLRGPLRHRIAKLAPMLGTRAPACREAKRDAQGRANGGERGPP